LYVLCIGVLCLFLLFVFVVCWREWICCIAYSHIFFLLSQPDRSKTLLDFGQTSSFSFLVPHLMPKNFLVANLMLFLFVCFALLCFALLCFALPLLCFALLCLCFALLCFALLCFVTECSYLSPNCCAVELFIYTDFFDEAPIFIIPERRYPVDILYTKVAHCSRL
jgi:hypothetical protein